MKAIGQDGLTARRLAIAAGDRPAELATAIQSRAQALGLQGWARGDADAAQPLAVHAEGPLPAVQALIEQLGALAGTPIEVTTVKPEGHEQFGIRGVAAGAFVVQEHQATAHHYDLRLEVDGVMRSWAVPKGPSLDPAVKRLAVEVEDHDLSHRDGTEGAVGDGATIVWDRGVYEQGGRVPWPEAIERGHAVFVLHGVKLHGGFALQRTGRTGPGGRPQWLLIKRRDNAAQPGVDVTEQAPQSVVSGRTLAELLDGD